MLIISTYAFWDSNLQSNFINLSIGKYIPYNLTTRRGSSGGTNSNTSVPLWFIIPHFELIDDILFLFISLTVFVNLILPLGHVCSLSVYWIRLESFRPWCVCWLPQGSKSYLWIFQGESATGLSQSYCQLQARKHRISTQTCNNTQTQIFLISS